MIRYDCELMRAFANLLARLLKGQRWAVNGLPRGDTFSVIEQVSSLTSTTV